MPTPEQDLERTKYPHLLPEEAPLWRGFLENYGRDYDWFDYDVRVGEGTIPPEHFTEEEQRAVIMLTQKRIDVVGHKGSEIWLFEVRPRASLSAVGQLIGYQTLYEKKYGTTRPIRRAVVTDQTMPDVEDIYIQNGINLFYVRPVRAVF